MTAAIYGVATAIFLLAFRFYWNRRFVPALFLELAYLLLLAWVASRAMGPALRWVAIPLLALLPILLLLVHALDATRGRLLLPTVYAIPAALLSGTLLWAACGLALLP